MTATMQTPSTNYLISKCVTAIILLCLLNSACTRPPPPFKLSAYNGNPSIGFEEMEDKCNTEESVQILCQTCAKVTKSEIVYPMCCTNKEDARLWCDRYTSFGIQ